MKENLLSVLFWWNYHNLWGEIVRGHLRQLISFTTTTVTCLLTITGTLPIPLDLQLVHKFIFMINIHSCIPLQHALLSWWLNWKTCRSQICVGEVQMFLTWSKNIFLFLSSKTCLHNMFPMWLNWIIGLCNDIS